MNQRSCFEVSQKNLSDLASGGHELNRNDKQANKVLNLLRSTEVNFEVLSDAQSRNVASQFIDNFISIEKRESLHLNLARARNKQKPIDFHKYFPQTCCKDVTEVLRYNTLLGWLSCGGKWVCFLVFGEPWIEPLKTDTFSLKDSTLSLFPDSYWVNFETKRVVAVTRDGDSILCELDG